MTENPTRKKTGSPKLEEQPSKVLVAEDELLLAQSLEADLQELGCEVIGPAPNGKRAIDLAKENRPDIALLDMRMPEMDGLTAAQILWKQMQIPIVVLSAYSDREYVERATELGVFGYLLKPVSLDDLRVTLSVAWGRYKAQVGLTDDVADLKQRLEDRKVVERAKGILMESLGISEPEAMRRLQKQARDSRRQMADLARSLLDAQGLLDNTNKPGAA